MSNIFNFLKLTIAIYIYIHTHTHRYIRCIYDDLFTLLPRVLVAHAGPSLHHVGSFCCNTHTSCGVQASAVVLLCGMLCGVLVPPPGIELASLALQGGLLTPGPLGKWSFIFLVCLIFVLLFQILPKVKLLNISASPSLSTC